MTELRLQANDDNLSAVNAFVEEQLEANECPMKASMQMMIALEELFVNVAHYAYGGGEGMVTVQVEKQEDLLLVRLIDEGRPFDPLAKADPNITLSAEERQIGGLGIYMVKKTMDVFTYTREDGKNIVTFGKKC